MERTAKLTSYLSAGYCCFWVKTCEPDRVVAGIKHHLLNFTCKDGGVYKMSAWNCDKKQLNMMEPFELLSGMTDLSIMVMVNYHWFIDKPPVIQRVQNSVPEWSSHGKAIMIISPFDKIPLELEKMFLKMELELPDEDEILDSIGFIAESTKKSGKDIEMPTGNELVKVVDASKGLTKVEMENVFSLSVIESGRFDPIVIGHMKDSAIESNGLLEVVQPDATFDNIRGYDQIKGFALRTIADSASLGFLMVGPPGCGKTLFMKCLAGETGIKTVSLNWGRLMSKFQGETDANVEAIIDIIVAIGRVIVMVDEFEKQFAGAGGDGTLDSGTTRRATGRWLRFMSERPEGVYIIGTCNDLSGIPTEYLRIGRWDCAPFYIGLPSDDEKADILDYYVKKHNIKPKQLKAMPAMTRWTGSEIEGCVRLAARMNVTLGKAADFIIPISQTAMENVDVLENWAKLNAIPATSIDINGAAKRKTRRISGGKK